MIAILAAVFGFSGIAVGAAEVAKFLFYLFLAVAVVGFAIGMFNWRQE